MSHLPRIVGEGCGCHSSGTAATILPSRAVSRMEHWMVDGEGDRARLAALPADGQVTTIP